jgi:hypothetical protein
MPARRTKVPYNGIMRDAEEVHVDSMNEHVNTYQLDDGSVVSLRTVVINAARVLDEYDQEGQPVYIIRHQTLLTVSAPEALKRRGS